jgi:gamma-glutamylcyclotransferase
VADSFVYFAYGSNMLTRRLRARTPSAIAIETGFIEGCRLAFEKVSLDGSGKCTILRAVDRAQRVYGVLFRIDTSEAQKLDTAEGLGTGYRKFEARVITPTGTSAAVSYIGDKTDSLWVPYDWYKELVIAGAVEHGLPSTYIDGLRSVASRADPNRDRDARNRAILF